MMSGATIKKSYTIKSDVKEMKTLIKSILTVLKKQGLSEDLVYDIRLATEEAVINAIKHGNGLKREIPVNVDFSCGDGKVAITVQDHGKGYDYKNVPDPTLEENIIKGCGRGVFLMRQLMDEVHYNSTGTRVEMVKFLNK